MTIYINCEGQVLLSFALGVLLSPYTYKLLWIIISLMIFEVGYWLLLGEWFIQLRLGLIIAYALGLIVGLYAIDKNLPFI